MQGGLEVEFPHLRDGAGQRGLRRGFSATENYAVEETLAATEPGHGLAPMNCIWAVVIPKPSVVTVAAT
uniref:Uncharacterized protein n=1 Tax=mine drainage metagenome TaxID=410659 RepID=E6QVU2_9ZZZZ